MSTAVAAAKNAPEAPHPDKARLTERLLLVSAALKELDLGSPHLVRRALDARFGPGTAFFDEVKALVRAGVDARWLCDRENGGVRFSRIRKQSDAEDFSIDVVHMNGAGAPHTHPNGEVSLAFAASGAPRFDGYGEGFSMYGRGSWHVPTVTGGAMDIVYFLPGGSTVFGERPK